MPLGEFFIAAQHWDPVWTDWTRPELNYSGRPPFLIAASWSNFHQQRPRPLVLAEPRLPLVAVQGDIKLGPATGGHVAVELHGFKGFTVINIPLGIG